MCEVKRVKSFLSQMANRAMLIAVSLALSQNQLTLQDH